MSPDTKLKTGNFAVTAAMVALCGAPAVNADALGDIQPHPPTGGSRVLHLSALAWSGSGLRGSPELKHQVSLDQPRHGMLGARRTFISAPATKQRAFQSPSRCAGRSNLKSFVPHATSGSRGLPLLHLWQSESGEHLLAIGLNGHGVPGIYLTQKVPD